MSIFEYRYPGVRPFDRTQSDRFRGRDEVIVGFKSLVLQEKLCVLYGKSGYGKSSLLNAGLQPALEAETAKGKRRFVPVPVRFLAASGQSDDNLYEQFAFHLARAMDAAQIAYATTKTTLPATLWGAFKGYETDSNTVFLLLFDQFEELFSYPSEQQQAFSRQLAELLYSDYPQFLEEHEESLPIEERSHLAEKIQIHAVLAIRADRMSDLDRLKDQLPAILHKRFELRALPMEEASRALTEPAALEGKFHSNDFAFEATALQVILNFLKDADGLVDPIQMQILAESFEQRVIKEKIQQFRVDNIGDLRSVIARYYSDKIAALADPTQRYAVRRLCEEGLAQEGDPPIRLSLHAAQIRQFYGIGQALLSELVNNRLLRAEAGRGGGTTYELPHDTLLGAVLEAGKERQAEEKEAQERMEAVQLNARLHEAEEKAKEEQQRAEEAERLKKQAEQGRRRARNFSLLAALVAIVAIGLGVLVWTKQGQAQMAIAEVVRLTIKDADKSIYSLDYKGALQKLRSAVPLSAAKKELSQAFHELALYYNETGDLHLAQNILDTMSQLMNLSRFECRTQVDLREVLKNLDPKRDSFLMDRYFPNMIDIPEGASLIGGESGTSDERPSHIVSFAPFKIARTETTWWQYNIYCETTQKNKPQKPAGWGGLGDNPVVYVSWFDAIDYANWLNEKNNIEKTIVISQEEGVLPQVISHTSGYRLPTEAEWEYVAREGKNNPYDYAGSNFIDSVAWYGKNSGNQTQQVAKKKANIFGIYDMSGNAYEWCWDIYQKNYNLTLKSTQYNPYLIKSETHRVVRGGSWVNGFYHCRSLKRAEHYATTKSPYFGFRVVQGIFN